MPNLKIRRESSEVLKKFSFFLQYKLSKWHYFVINEFIRVSFKHNIEMFIWKLIYNVVLYI